MDTPRSGRPPTAGGIVWHTLGADQILHSQRVDGQRGLSSAEAAARTQRFGPNELEQWLLCTAVGLSAVMAAEIRKAVLRRPTN